MSVLRDGFVRVASASIPIQVGNCGYHREQILVRMREAEAQDCDLLVFPELCLTGYTCGDLFLQDLLLDAAKAELIRLTEETRNYSCAVLVGLPLLHCGLLYNCGAVLYGGKVLGIVPKRCISPDTEYYETRYFTPYTSDLVETVSLGEAGDAPFGSLLFDGEEAAKGFSFAVEIGKDLWQAESPSVALAKRGATILCNLCGDPELVGAASYRRLLVQAQSAKLMCAYVLSNAGEGESTTDLVFAGQKLIGENGKILAETAAFGEDLLVADVDVAMLSRERRRGRLAKEEVDATCYVKLPMPTRLHRDLRRKIAPSPFVPEDEPERATRAREILEIQVSGLCKRLSHTGIGSAVIGISGGLDSTLALLVVVKAYDRLQHPRSEIVAVTMPCFGTSDRTYQNAVSLCRELGVTLREISIGDAVTQHFSDIGHDPTVHNVTYENSQARERTQVLMDIANQVGGMVIGTGDVSELALGWATYNGDHMSMYGVNGSVPKTWVRHLVSYVASQEEGVLQAILQDVVDTPVSPELLPPEEGKISQKTEDLVGPYELHDFFLFYFVRYGFGPSKIFRLAKIAFAGRFEEETIRKWLRIFVRRFFRQQYKRSCLPDGPKVGSVSLSPRGDFRMASDVQANLWRQESENL